MSVQGKSFLFWKFEGTGNDFIFIQAKPFKKPLIQDICKIHTGIGADGCVFVWKDKFFYYETTNAIRPKMR